MTKKGLVIGAVVLAVVAAATVAYASSALQLFASDGLGYIKHVNFNVGSGARTILLVKNLRSGDALLQVRIAARATDGSNVSQTRTLSLRGNETRSLAFAWNKNITDLNFIQLIRARSSKKPEGSDSGSDSGSGSGSGSGGD